MAVCHQQTAQHTEKGKIRVISTSKRKYFSSGNHSCGAQIRLIMHLRASGTALARPPDPQPQWQCASSGWPLSANAYGLGHPTSLKYTILSSMKDSRQVYFFSFFILTCSDEEKIEPSKSAKKRLSPEMIKKNNRTLNLKEKNTCAQTSIHAPPPPPPLPGYTMVNALGHCQVAELNGLHL